MAVIYTLSVRSKEPMLPALVFLGRNYGDIPIDSVDSVFGFVEKSTLYGGREFVQPELVDRDVKQLNAVGIGIRLPLSNHHVSREEFAQNRELLEKYHRRGNAVIVTNDDLAGWIREEFPEYRIEASVIKNINTQQKLEEALRQYDTVVLPMSLNRDHELLERLPDKNRITLFGNGGCALTCPSKTCYPSISKLNKFTGEGKFQCSQPLKERKLEGMLDFDLEQLQALGYSRFKMLRSRPGGKTGF
ncbi:MAG: hypothetical protein HOC23_20860 [Halieaceae bacterium]|nr:hypothetical protein [Halieaceae bacterium]